MPDDSIDRRTFVQRTSATVAGGALVGAASTTATASSDDAPGILGASFTVDRDLPAFLGGASSSLVGSFSRPEETATLADRARNEFNANQDSWLSYGNWLFETEDVDPIGSATVQVDFVLTRSRWPTTDERTPTHIEVAYDEGASEFTGLEWVDGAADSPDYEVELRDIAAENAADELSAYRRQWIGDSEADHRVPTDEYLNELAGTYWSAVSVGGDAQSVLEILVGEVSR